MDNEQFKQRSVARAANHNQQQTKNAEDTHSHHHRSRCCRCLPTMTRASRLLMMLGMTFGYFLIELIFGYVSHSMALIADSFHMMSDVMALGIAYGCLKIAERSKSSKNTFGWVRAEVLGALVNGVFLLALCFTILIESIQRLLEPEPIKNPAIVLVVGTIGFLINLIGMVLFHGHVGHTHAAHGVEDVRSEVQEVVAEGRGLEEAESRNLLNSHQDRAMAMAELEAMEESLMTRTPRTKKDKSGGDHLNMRAVFLHVLGDAVGSVIVIATALVSWLVEGYDWLKLYMDPSLSIIMVCLMVCTTFPLVRETALILLQTTPHFVNVDKLQSELLKIEGIVAVHEFHVWRLVGERIIATVHIRFHTLRHYVLAAEQIRALFHDNHIHSTTIQPEFAEMNTSTNTSLQECAFACLPTNCSVLETGTVTCCDKVGAAGNMRTSPPKKLTEGSASITIEDDSSPPAVMNTASTQSSQQQLKRSQSQQDKMTSLPKSDNT